MSNKIFIGFGLFILLVFGCENEQNQLKTNKKNPIADTASNQKAQVGIDEFLPLENPQFTCSVLQKRSYHADEVSSKVKDAKWVGLFKNEKGYYLKSTILTTTRKRDPLGDSDNKMWIIQNDNKDDCIVMMDGLKLDRQYQIEHIPLKNIELDPWKTSSFKFGENKYEFYTTVDSIAPNQNDPYGLIVNYRVFVKGIKNGRSFNQLINTNEFYTDEPSTILFIGDLDQDGIPDLVMNTSGNYNVEDIAVFLTRCAGNNQLYKKVGNRRSTGC